MDPHLPIAATTTIVCCLCGDVGFSDRLFRCSTCRRRFQHSYCSNYCGEEDAAKVGRCDWCRSEELSSSSRAFSSFRYTTSKSNGAQLLRSPYNVENVKQHNRTDGGGGGAPVEKGAGKSPSPRPSVRRYKLLKDVMC